jgi:hypothetical protein
MRGDPGLPPLPFPRFRLRTLMIAVPIAGVALALAIKTAAGIGSVSEVLVLLVLLSIAWVPGVLVFLPPKAAGWLSLVAILASILSLTFAVYHAAAGNPWRETGFSTCVATFWLTFAFGIGYVATKALHLPDRTWVKYYDNGQIKSGGKLDRGDKQGLWSENGDERPRTEQS